MLLATIHSDILLVHLLPNISPTDVRSLAATNMHLSSLLDHLRFFRSNVRNYGGFFNMVLRPSTVQTIREITLNGSETEHDEVFRCANLAGTVSAIVVTPITERQRVAFTIWAKNLRYLAEETDGNPDASSCLTHLDSSTLENLRLEISIPADLGGLRSTHLHTIQFLPCYDPTNAAQYVNYISQLERLLCIISDASRFPALKIVQATPTPISERHQKAPHLAFLLALWTSATAHGGWKLLCRKPTIEPSAGTYWGSLDWDFTLRIKEFLHLSRLIASSHGTYPRLSFLHGRIHIQTAGGTTPARSTLLQTPVFGVSILHRRSTNMTAALSLVTGDTRVVSIALSTHWGSPGRLPAGAARPRSLRISGPRASHYPLGNPAYGTNYAAAFAAALLWPGIVHLALPALAFQARTPGASALCGVHMGAYDMGVLRELKVLRTLCVSEWASCVNCYPAPGGAFENGLRWVPEGVESVAIGGRMGYYGPVMPAAVVKLAVYVVGLLKAGRPSVVVDLRGLWVERIETGANLAEMERLAAEMEAEWEEEE